MEEEKKKNGEYVGVDDKYIPEDEKYVSDSVVGKEKTEKKLATGYIICLAVFFVLFFGIIMFVMFKIIGTSNKMIGNAENMIYQSQVEIEQQKNEINEKQKETEQMIKDAEERQNAAENEVKDLMIDNQNKSKIDSHNRTLADLYTGSQSGFNVKSALNKVIEINQRDDVKITVNYNETGTQDASQIVSLSSNFEDTKNYLIVYDYNSDGYIITMNISNI